MQRYKMFLGSLKILNKHIMGTRVDHSRKPILKYALVIKFLCLLHTVDRCPSKAQKPLRSSAQVTVMFMIVKHRIFPPVGRLKFSIVWIFFIGT